MKAAAFIFSVALISQAQARVGGGVDGGGGVGVRCPVGSAPKEFELLDLHESRLHSLPSSWTPKSQEEAIELTATLLAKQIWNRSTMPLSELTAYYRDHLIGPIFNGQPIVDPDSGTVELNVVYGPPLPLSKDIGQYEILPGCHLEQVAYTVDNTRTMYFDKVNWDQLDWLDKSALVAHEAVFAMDRGEGLEYFNAPPGTLTSERTRRFVGLLYSVKGVTPNSDSVPEDSAYCVANDISHAQEVMTYFYAFPTGQNELTTVFNLIEGFESAYQMKAIFSHVDLNNLMDIKNGAVQSSTSLTFTDEADAPPFTLQLVKQPGSQAQFQAFSSRTGQPVPVGPVRDMNCYSK